MDGDAAPIQQIEDAIRSLKCDFTTVSTTVFAAPGRMDNARWKQFIHSAPGVHFKPVPRQGISGQPTDDEMLSEVERLSHSRGAGCIAVLSSDSRLTLEIIRLAIEGNMRAIAFGPNIQAFYREQFESLGAEVRHLDPERSIPFKVRGVLHTDKTGTHELADSNFFLQDTACIEQSTCWIF